MRLSTAGTVLIPVLLSVAMAAQQSGGNLSNASVGSTQISQSNSSAESKPAPQEASNPGHKYHIKLGTVAVTGGYASGPFWYPYGPYGYYPFYDVALWNPFWGPFGPYYYPADIAFGNGKGQIELKAEPKDAEVYIDGAYAGTVQHLKHFWLEPGVYDLSISAAGREPFQQRIYVLTGKTMSIDASLSPRQAASGGSEEKR
jgi:hypothetical protein